MGDPRGWMLIRCRKCRHLKTYRAPVPVREYKCDCGGITPIRNMVPIKTCCPCCGQELRYMTNITEKQYTFICFRCGAPVDLEWNERKERYE